MSLEFGYELIRDNHHLWLLPGLVANVAARQGRIRILPLELGLQARTMGILWRRDQAIGHHTPSFTRIIAAIVQQQPYS